MAKEYIEREAALMGVMRAGCLANTVQVLKDIPAADVVEVVRCAECKNWGGVIFGNVCRRWRFSHLGSKNSTKPNDFCFYGERRDNNAAD